MPENKIIGLYKVLDNDDEIISESHALVPVLQVKEAFLKKALNRTERRDMPISLSQCKVFLTRKKLVFLILKQQFTGEFGGQETQSGIVGTWFEIPTKSLIDYEIRPLDLHGYSKDFRNDLAEVLDDDQQSCLEIIYDEKEASGRSKDYIESMMKRGKLSKMFGKVVNITDKIMILGSDAVALAPNLKQFMNDDEKESLDKDDPFFCSKCGTQQKDMESRFCSKCGSSFQPTIENK